MTCVSTGSRTIFSTEQAVVLSVVCLGLLPLLLLAARAVGQSSKLPSPFKALCLCVLLLDALVAIATAVEPWLHLYTHYDRDIGDLGILLVNTVTTLMTVERVSALKFPLKYIACNNNRKLTICIATATLIVETALYGLFRVLPCLLLAPEQDTQCDIYHINFIMVVQLTLSFIATVCFLVVVYQASKSKRKHTRCVSQLGLPLTYASNATNSHISAVLFILFPIMMFVTLFSLLFALRCVLNNVAFFTWCSVLSRIVMFTAHGVLFNVWFDEGRLHLLTVLSPLGTRVRKRADEMRIQVYNIVVAHAYDQTTQQAREFRRMRQTGCLRQVEAGLPQSPRPNRDRTPSFICLRKIEENDTAC